MPREWDTPIRESWNGPIRSILNAIDNHVVLYTKTHNKWHLEQAKLLRNYVSGLKTWIHEEERKHGV